MIKFFETLFQAYAQAAEEIAQHDPLRPGASDRI
jgi:hypothetical protein